jgi:hypothetical protein
VRQQIEVRSDTPSDKWGKPYATVGTTPSSTWGNPY